MVSRHTVAQNPAIPIVLTSTGPVAQNVKAETAKTKNEFADLANARTTPDQPAATGQPLTRKTPRSCTDQGGKLT